MQAVQVLRSSIKSSSPISLWPTNRFARIRKLINKNLADAQKETNHQHSYAWKEDVKAPPRFIKFAPDGTWLHSNTGNKFLDSTFSLWIKASIHKFEHVLKEAVLKNVSIYIYGKYHQRKLHVYFMVVDDQVIYRTWHLRQYLPDQQGFAIPEIIQSSTFNFGKAYTHSSRDYEEFFPEHNCIAFPIRDQLGKSIDLGMFEMLVFVSNK